MNATQPVPVERNPLDTTQARTLYLDMVLTRRLDEEAIALQRQGVLPAYAPVRGQEAAQVASAACLDPRRDFAFPTYRELGVAVTLGVDPVDYLATHLATWHGGLYDPLATGFGSINAVVGGPVPHATGWAMGAQLDNTGGVALTYFGDGASSQGDVHEAMNFAAVYSLPVVFFCQNNGWAISLPTERQVAGGSVAARAAGYGMPGHNVDGNDVEQVHRATHEAITRAREGRGPSVIEAMTYRLGPHSTSDDPGRYRSLAEEQQHEGTEPVSAFARHLMNTSQLSATELAVVEDEANERASRIRDDLTTQSARPGADMFAHTYREPTVPLLEQWRSWEDARA